MVGVAPPSVNVELPAVNVVPVPCVKLPPTLCENVDALNDDVPASEKSVPMVIAPAAVVDALPDIAKATRHRERTGGSVLTPVPLRLRFS